MSGIYERSGKRVLDLAVLAVAAPVALPLLAGIAALLAVAQGRPVLFRQARVGRDGADFTILKFRTMAVGSELEGDGYWGNAEDPRITPAGRVLRSTSLDELPQLLNVLSGDMSLVGPRPKPRDIVDRYRSRYGGTLRVRPGLTGLWVVRGRNELRRSELIALDQEYARHVTLSGDLRILLQTVPVVLFRRGFFTPDRSEQWMEDVEPDPG
jgi:lipopolysaccharide/colanic/teichoic acid biosynthesis glycosyltransferase